MTDFNTALPTDRILCLDFTVTFSWKNIAKFILNKPFKVSVFPLFFWIKMVVMITRVSLDQQLNHNLSSIVSSSIESCSTLNLATTKAALSFAVIACPFQIEAEVAKKARFVAKLWTVCAERICNIFAWKCKSWLHTQNSTCGERYIEICKNRNTLGNIWIIAVLCSVWLKSGDGVARVIITEKQSEDRKGCASYQKMLRF